MNRRALDPPLYICMPQILDEKSRVPKDGRSFRVDLKQHKYVIMRRGSFLSLSNAQASGLEPNKN
ncbi:hypothetical protein LB503_009591 [Fusarium chuoi]|nr:hypothetical protein LB503_009591 [Fusarium chuoi]